MEIIMEWSKGQIGLRLMVSAQTAPTNIWSLWKTENKEKYKRFIFNKIYDIIDGPQKFSMFIFPNTLPWTSFLMFRFDEEIV